jgi:hypothetical protein
MLISPKHPFASVARRVKACCGCSRSVPVIWPVELFSVKAEGRLPAETL